MTRPVSLEALADEVLGLMFDWRALFNKETGEIVSDGWVDEGVVGEHEEEDFDGPEWIEVPYPDEDTDWRTMGDFAGAAESEDARDRLWVAVNERRPFRSFRAQVRALGLEEAWFRHQESAMRRNLKGWLDALGLPYVEQAPASKT